MRLLAEVSHNPTLFDHLHTLSDGVPIRCVDGVLCTQQSAAVPVAAAAVLRLLAEFERGLPDAALLQTDSVAAAVQHALVGLTSHLAERPDGPATGAATAVRCILTVIFRDAQAYKSGN